MPSLTLRSALKLATAFALASLPAVAADTTRTIGTHGAWTVFASEESGHPLCYMSAVPAKSTGAPAKRGAVFFIVTDRPADHQAGIVSYNPGLTLKPATTVKVSVAKASWPLFVARNTGWANDGDDAKIVDAMHKGETLTVTITPAKGEPIVDHFALAASGDATKALDAACKMGSASPEAAAKPKSSKSKAHS